MRERVRGGQKWKQGLKLEEGATCQMCGVGFEATLLLEGYLLFVDALDKQHHEHTHQPCCLVRDGLSPALAAHARERGGHVVPRELVPAQVEGLAQVLVGLQHPGTAQGR